MLALKGSLGKLRMSCILGRSFANIVRHSTLITGPRTKMRLPSSTLLHVLFGIKL